MKYKDKITKILVFSNWSQSRFANILGVNVLTINRWKRGRRVPQGDYAEIIDRLFDELVAPYACELEEKADELAEKLLNRQIDALADDNTCMSSRA